MRREAPTSVSKSVLVRMSVVALLVALLPAPPASAHAIDYISTSISPAAMFDGASGNFTLNAPINAGGTITFDLTFAIVAQGNTTTFPRTVMFGGSTTMKPAGATDATVTLQTSTFTFANASSSFTTPITIVAPSTPGGYTVKIAPTSGTGGPQGLSGGGGVAVSFVVASGCAEAETSLEVTGDCVTYHQSATTLSATLTAGGSPLAGYEVSFFVDGDAAGSAFTDASGIASLAYDPSGLSAGDHTVSASFAGDGCAYEASAGSATLGVSYVFVGFQQPINADGSSQFGGRVIPVKVRVVDANGVPVSDASAHVFFAFGMPTLVGTDAEPVGNTSPDGGNTMRYDPVAQQYVFNWDVGSLQNGTYTVRVDLGEGSCGDAHTVVVSLKRKGK